MPPLVKDTRCHVVHVVYSFGVGGLENVIVQLINRLPVDRYRHTVLAMTTITDFKARLQRDDVELIALNKPPGHAIPLYPAIWRLFRRLAPDVLHTCNLAALELVPLGWLAGIPRRIHAEHGWDAHDRDGSNPRYRRLRRLYRPFVTHYVAVSRDIERYLETAIGVPDARRHLIANGVDTEVFHPLATPGLTDPVWPVSAPVNPRTHRLIGTIGRLQTVKNQPLLAKAFVRLLEVHPEMRDTVRLVILGEGPLRTEVEAILRAGACLDLAWLPGARADIPDLLPFFDVFVLPSQTEGTSCTLQEALACAVPVVATAVGGAPDVLGQGAYGTLVPSDNVDAMVQALAEQLNQPQPAQQRAMAGRTAAIKDFSLAAMWPQYDQLFSA